MPRLKFASIAIGDCMLDVISEPGDRAKAKLGFDRALAGESFVVEEEYGDSELARLYWQNFMSPIRNADSSVTGLTVFVLNITERRRAERALALREQEFRTFVEHSTDLVGRFGPDLRRLYVNPAASRSTPGGVDAMLGRTPREYPGGEGSDKLERALAEVFRTGRPIEVEVEVEASSRPGDERCHLVSVTPEFDEQGTVVSALTVGRDVTELNASRRKIHQMAFYDTLTGLPNRALFQDRLTQIIADARWHGQTAGVVLIDMDRFKAINDTMGHAAGDQLLRDVGKRLTACVRPYDTVARLGGDEFTVLLPEIREIDDLGRIADKIREQFTRSFVLEITERLLLERSGPGLDSIVTLRGMGFTVAIDDFGTGYSALSYLTGFPLDTLKIDSSFVHEATADPARRPLIGAVMTIADCLGLRVVAEGVETAEQAAALQEQGCLYAQGYYFQRPVGIEDFEVLPDHLP